MQVKDLIVTGDARIVGNLYTNTGALVGGSGSGGGSSSSLTYTLSKSGSTITLKGSDGTTSSVTDNNTDTNTTYSFASGDSNGQIKVTPSSGSAYNVSVKGLGSAAYVGANSFFKKDVAINFQDIDAAKVKCGNEIMVSMGTTDSKTHLYLGDLPGNSSGHSGNTYINAPSGTIVMQNGVGGGLIFDNYTTDSIQGCFRPANPSTLSLGRSAAKWYKVWAETGTIQTSDRRVKSNIMAIADYPTTYTREGGSNVFEKLFKKLQPSTYTLHKDNTNQLYIGFVAQDIEESIEELGLTTDDLALIDHSYWIDEETGEQKDAYGLSYEQFIALNTHMIQKQQGIIENQQEQISQLEERISQLEELIK